MLAKTIRAGEMTPKTYSRPAGYRQVLQESEEPDDAVIADMTSSVGSAQVDLRLGVCGCYWVRRAEHPTLPGW